jgi:uncharacterized protein YutE (UPF0331/DUF86 family)
MTPGHPDSAVVRRHRLAMQAALQNLQRHQNSTLAELQLNLDQLWAIERGLQLIAQNALDIATHLVAAAGFDSVDYTTAIDRLVTIRALSPEFAARFRGIAGFRNVLVHGYLEVDLMLVQRVLCERLPDFTEFAQSIERYLASEP